MFPQWVHECFETKKKLPEKDFLIHDCSGVVYVDNDNDAEEVGGEKWDDQKMPVLPDYFDRMVFAIDSNSLIDQSLKKKIVRYIFAYGGEVVTLEDISTQSQDSRAGSRLYVVCGDTAPSSENVERLEGNNVECFHYSWILITHELQKQISIDDFLVKV